MGDLAAALGGLCVGSFLNVVIHRLPREESLVRPRSRCPRCGKPIAWYDNVPLVSWAVLAGRCRRCRARIPARYPLVEALTAALCWALWRRWGLESPVFAALAAGAAAALVAVAFIDWDTFLIPDELSLGLTAAGLLLSPVNALLAEGWPWRVAASAAGAAFGFALTWGAAELGERLFKKEAMGGGDIKLMAGVGAWTGMLGAFDCLVVASFLGASYGLALMVSGRLKRSDPIPFGPFLSAAAVFGFFYLLPFGFPFHQP